MARRKKTKKSSFRGKVNRNAQKTKAGSSYGYLNLPKGVSVFSPAAPSRAMLDFMPYKVTDPRHPDRDDDLEIAVPGSLWYKRPFKVHRNIGANNEAVVCLQSVGKKCPICIARADMIKQGADKEDTDALKPSMRCLYVVIPKKHKKFEEAPHIFDISQYMFQNLLTEELEEDEDNEVFPDLEEGKTLKIRFSAKTIGKSKPFPEATRIDFIDRKKPYDESILDDIPNLDKVLNILSYSQLERMFLDIEDDEEDEQEEDNAPWEDDGPEDDDGNKPYEEWGFDSLDELEEELDEMNVREMKYFIEENEIDLGGTKVTKKGLKGIRSAIMTLAKAGTIEREEKPKKSKGKKKKQKTKKKSRCPHGHEFGIDLDEFDECDDCEKWDDCLEAN